MLYSAARKDPQILEYRTSTKYPSRTMLYSAARNDPQILEYRTSINIPLEQCSIQPLGKILKYWSIEPL